MKKYFALLFACALLAPMFAYAQEPQIEGLRSAKKANLVRFAGKPALTRVSIAITAAERKSIHEMAIKNSGIKLNAGNRLNSSNGALTGTVELTPDLMFTNSVYTIGNHPSYFEPSTGQLLFAPDEPNRGGSNLTFYISTSANTEYTLGCLVRTPQTSPTFMFSSSGSTDKVNGVYGDNKFAYAFVSNSAGVIGVSIGSPDAYWAFLSCEITAAPL